MRAVNQLIGDAHWEFSAACRSENPALFEPLTRSESYAARGNTPTQPEVPTRIERVRDALEICADCPVWKLCLVTRANYTDIPQTGVYGRAYVSESEGKRRLRRAKTRAGLSAQSAAWATRRARRTAA